MGKRAGTGPASEPAPGRAGARFPSPRRLAKLSRGNEDFLAPEPEARRAPAQSSGAASEREFEQYAEPDSEAAQSELAGSDIAEWPDESEFEAQESLAPQWPAEPPVEPPPASAGWGRPAGAGVAPPEPEEFSGPRVRPYVLTKGRTHSTYELRLETMVSLRADAVWEGPALAAEYQPVRALCTTPRSVAEVAALLSVPIGVARVLLSDMADLGLMHIHGTERTAEGRPPVALMRRVLSGLQKKL